MANEFLSNRLFFVLSAITAVILISLLGCSSTGENPCAEIEDKFKPLEGVNRSLHIYADTSESMSGFLSDSNSSYSAFVKRYLPNITGGSEYTEYSVFKFGDTVSSPHDISILAKRYAYIALHTIFSNVFQHINVNNPAAFIIISDMVISAGNEEGSDRVKVIRLVKELSQKGYSFAIKGIKSSFGGDFQSPAFSEILEGRKIGIIRQPIQRPFYILFGYKKGFEPVSLLSLKTIEQAEVKDISFVNPSNIFELFIDYNGSNFYLNGRDIHGKCDVVKWKKSDITSSRIKAIIETSKQPGGTLLTFRDVALQTMPKQKEPVKIMMLDQPERTDSRLKIKLEIPRIQSKKEYTYYVIDFFISSSNFKMPEWADNWSTSTDTSIEDYDRTFGFKDLINAITNGIVKTERFYLR